MFYGLYENPPDTIAECSICDNIGKSFAAIQIATVSLEATRHEWIDADYVLNQSWFDLIGSMLGIYIRFWGLGYNLDILFHSDTMDRLATRVVQKLNFAYLYEFEQNVRHHFYMQSVILTDLPGNDCEKIGARIGIAIRRLTSLRLDDIDL